MDTASKIVKEAGDKLSAIQADVQTGKLSIWDALKQAYLVGQADTRKVFEDIYCKGTSYDGK